MPDKKRILIVGGVAGGASCAARCRRLSEAAEIVMFDRGPYVSFANCGLPYYVGNVIKNEEDLLVATPDMFQRRFNIDVRLRSNVVSIDRENRTIQVMDLENGTTYTEAYDALVLSPGAHPIRPPLPGIDLAGIFSVRTIPDSRQILQWIHRFQARDAVVVGGGYIGMEMTENLHKRGIQVTVVERLPQVMPLLDPEMVAPIHDALISHHIDLCLNDSVTRFDGIQGHRIGVNLESGNRLETDLVILCIGVRPHTTLAEGAGLTIAPSGGIQVDQQMRTSDPNIWAVGDAVEINDVITGQRGVVPLAGPANRQGRIAADVIMGRDSTFRGVQGTSVVGVLNQVAAFTGASEKTLKRLGMWEEMEKIYLHPGHHAGYYPGATPISLKLIFRKSDGRIFGAQAIGQEGVEKRIDVIAMAMQKESTVYDLEEAELCYAPQFGSAKDPVNMAGMIAANVLRGDARLAHWEEVETTDALILDVRDEMEYKQDHVEGATHLYLDDIRDRMNELPKDREIWTYCFVGQRSYYAARALSQYGFKVKNISGGFKSFTMHESIKYL